MSLCTHLKRGGLGTGIKAPMKPLRASQRVTPSTLVVHLTPCRSSSSRTYRSHRKREGEEYRGSGGDDVEELGAAYRAEAANERRDRPPQEARLPVRDRLLQEQGPLLAIRSVSSLTSP